MCFEALGIPRLSFVPRTAGVCLPKSAGASTLRDRNHLGLEGTNGLVREKNEGCVQLPQFSQTVRHFPNRLAVA
jgi:hypothetical protein